MINLIPRQEPSQQYDTNTVINNQIAEAFRNSCERIEGYPKCIVVPDWDCLTVDTQYNSTMSVGDIIYGMSTLKKSGCAVLCFCEGYKCTRSKDYVDLKALSEEIVQKGYYLGNGTYHNLFDHMGLRRATHFCEVIKTIETGRIVTCLVENAKYHDDEKRTGNHFVNVVGMDNDYLIIHDPHIGRRMLKFESFILSVLVAWTW